jgi:hypothetical protein
MGKELTNKEMLKAIYEKIVINPRSTPFDNPSGTQVEPSPGPSLQPQWNLFPEEGVVYPDIAVPDGYHLEYDYANHVVGVFKTCGPLGG